MMTTSKKKPKTANDNDDFETVKRYILDCPHVTANHPAIKAAIEGIEKEQARIERDAKLQRKFAGGTAINTTATTASTSPATTPNNNNLSESMVVIDKDAAREPSASPSMESSSDKDMQEWQDVSKSKEDGDDDVVCGNGIGDSSSSDDGGTSFLGKHLAKVAIDSIAQYQVKVKSPMAAIAAVLHASLRSELIGFKCTGIPEDASKSSGFAPPVRELPDSLFLPLNLDTTTASNSIALRYRKDGTGATILRVQAEDADPHGLVKISFQPATAKEPSSLYLSFAIDDHINLDSWNAAMKVSATVSPALHYKSLSALLSNFTRTFDLGELGNAADQSSEAPYVDNTVLPSSSSQNGQSPPQVIHKSDFVPGYVPGIAVEDRRKKPWQDGIGVPATLDQAFPSGRPVPHGDFQGDITPGGGLVDPRFAGSRPAVPGVDMPGNQMGPNHPMFSGDGIRGPNSIGPPVGGPGSMQPRFDPFYPPGVDIDIDGRPSRRPHQNNRPSRTGLPNPDHLPPPNSFGNDMFM